MRTRSGERTGARPCRGRVVRPGRRGQAGFSLLEALVALALLGIAFGGIAAGLLTTMRASTDNQQNVAANTALSNVAQQMKALAPPVCRDATAFRNDWNAGYGTRTMGGQPITVVVPAVHNWNTGSRTFTAATPCQTGSSQLVRLEVTVGGVTARGSVVVGDRVQP
jgi:prepilin-type N-terminal cleavage/methylation domain-containing protein